MPTHDPHQKSSLAKKSASVPKDSQESDEELIKIFLDNPVLSPDDFNNEEQIQELMEDYDLDYENAERVSDLMDEYDLDPEDAIEIDENL